MSVFVFHEPRDSVIFVISVALTLRDLRDLRGLTTHGDHRVREAW